MYGKKVEEATTTLILQSQNNKEIIIVMSPQAQDLNQCNLHIRRLTPPLTTTQGFTLEKCKCNKL